MDQRLVDAHKYARGHKEQLEKDSTCGCFFCEKIFEPSQIEYWLEDEGTAFCPHCGIDSIIGESSGYPIMPDFLSKMKKHWFY